MRESSPKSIANRPVLHPGKLGPHPLPRAVAFDLGHSFNGVYGKTTHVVIGLDYLVFEPQKPICESHRL